MTEFLQPIFYALSGGILVMLYFIFRERRIKRLYNKLKQELNIRVDEINKQERKISKQKEKLQHQIEVSDKQNALIHKQTIELEKHKHSLEKKVDIRTKELLEAKKKAEESDQLKTSFLENISHEIRTPMNAIMGFATLLGFSDIKREDQDMYVSRITSNCHALLHLIDGILDMSKLQAGQMTIHKTNFSVNKFCREFRDKLLLEISEDKIRSLKISLELPEKYDDFILYSDLLRIQQILDNLLNNAVKYTESGTIRFGYIPLFNSDYDKEPSELQFFVEDTGIGIAREKAEYVFNWFNKIEEDASKLYRGAGLGLFISKELVQLLGGKIWFNSKLNEGSTFYFSLPYLNTGELASKKGERLIAKRKAVSKEYDWRKKTILIVEDEMNNIIYLSEIIRKTNAKVLEAKTGQEAIDLVKSEVGVSLVLMDLMMPEMDGYEATRQIKMIKPSIPVIAQTAYTNAREKEKSLEAGCDGYISKPYNPPELLKLVNNFL